MACLTSVNQLSAAQYCRSVQWRRCGPLLTQAALSTEQMTHRHASLLATCIHLVLRACVDPLCVLAAAKLVYAAIAMLAKWTSSDHFAERGLLCAFFRLC